MDMVSPAPRRHERRSDPPLSSPAQAKFVKLEQKWVISLSISVQKLLWLRSPLSIGWWKINKLASILHHSIRTQSLDAFVFSACAFVSLYFDPLSHLGGGAPPEPRPSQECLWRCTERELSVHGMCKPTNTNTRHLLSNKYKYKECFITLSIDSYSCCPETAIIDHKQKVLERNAIWGPMSGRSLWKKSSKTKRPNSHLICSKIFLFCLLDHKLALFQRAHLVGSIKKQGKPELETNLRVENLVLIVSVPVHLFPLKNIIRIC